MRTRKSITRTLLLSKITAVEVTVKDGKPEFNELEVLNVMGKCDEKRALKELVKAYGERQYAVTSIEVSEKLYEISINDFVKYAKEVEKEKKAN